MKKLLILALALCMAASLIVSCAPGKDAKDTTSDTTEGATSPDGFDDVTAPPESDKKDETTKVEETTESNIINDAEEAIAAARQWLGESDPETGYKYAYSYDGAFLEEGKDPLFKIRVSWYIEEQERYSLCGYLLVSPYGEVTKFGW